jgi:hypothetical protein
MICFIAGFLAVIGGALATVVGLYSLTSGYSLGSGSYLQSAPQRSFSDYVLAAAPGIAIALVGIVLLFCSSVLDEHGPVRRYGKRRRKRS